MKYIFFYDETEHSRKINYEKHRNKFSKALSRVAKQDLMVYDRLYNFSDFM